LRRFAKFSADVAAEDEGEEHGEGGRRRGLAEVGSDQGDENPSGDGDAERAKYRAGRRAG
jgi:hypothetical protein